MTKLTRSHMRVLGVLHIANGQTYVGSISKQLKKQPQEVVSILEELEDQGWINVSRFGGGMVRTASLNPTRAEVLREAIQPLLRDLEQLQMVIERIEKHLADPTDINFNEFLPQNHLDRLATLLDKAESIVTYLRRCDG